MQASVGDRIIIKSHRVGDVERDCEVLEVRGPDGAPPYVVRWGDDGHELRLAGQVQWVNPVKALGENLNHGMGIHFLDLSPDDRERLVEAVHTIAYVRDLAQ